MMGRGRQMSVFDRQLGRAPHTLPERSPRCIAGSHVAKVVRIGCFVEAPCRSQVSCVWARYLSAHEKTVLPGLSPGSRGLSVCTPYRVPKSRRAASPALLLFGASDGAQIHCILPPPNIRILSCGTSRNGTMPLSTPSRAPRATRLTPPWLTATVLRSSPPSQSETLNSRSR